MKKIKLFIAVLVISTLCAIIPTIVNASETYIDEFKTADGIVAKKVVQSTNGDIEIQLSNIELDSEGSYTWGIGRSSNSADIEYTSSLGDYSASKKTAIISLVTSEKKVLEILRDTNNVYLFVKDEKNDNYIINGLKIDCTLAPLKAFRVYEHKDVSGYSWNTEDVAYAVSLYGNANDRDGSTYGIKKINFKFEKVTDNNLISQYDKAIEENTDIELLSNLKKLEDAPTTGWIDAVNNYKEYTSTLIKYNSVPKNAGLYYLWLKGKDTDSKTVIGYTLVKIKADGPSVKSISVTDPKSGTYDTTQTVKIKVQFDEKVTGTSVPTLKIQFGKSPVRSVTNGTIKDDYIEYSYNLQGGDIGQLATVSLEGGTIKDSDGNNAILSCPIISGNTIKANIAGTTTTQTDNKDKTVDTTTKTGTTTPTTTGTTVTQGTPVSTAGTTTTQTDKETPTHVIKVGGDEETTPAAANPNDNTTANVILPKTGVKYGIVLVILFVFGLGYASYKKYNNLKDIK